LEFAKFLDIMECDIPLSQYYSSRGALLGNSDLIHDNCYEQGIRSFPLARQETRTELLTADFQSEMGSTLRSERMLTSQRSMSTFGAFEPAEESEVSAIRDTGLRVKLPFVRWIIFAVLFYFALMSAVASFMPMIPIFDIVERTGTYWKMVDASNNVAIMVSDLSFLVTMNAASVNQLWPNPMDEGIRIGNRKMDDFNVPGLIRRTISSFLDMSNALIHDMADAVGEDTTAWRRFYKTALAMRLPNDNLNEIELAFPSALEWMQSLLVNYGCSNDSDCVSFMDERWVLTFLLNGQSLVEPLLNYSDFSHQDLLEMGDDAMLRLNIIVITFAVGNVIWIIIFFCLIRNMFRKWACIVKGLSQLPKSAIQRCSERFTATKRVRSLAGEERLYNSDFGKMVTARKAVGGFPVFKISASIGVIIVLSMLSTCVSYLVIGDRLNYGMSCVERYTVMSKMTTLFYRTCGRLIRYCIGENGTLCNANNTFSFPVDEKLYANQMAIKENLKSEINFYSNQLREDSDKSLIGSTDRAAGSFGLLDSQDEDIHAKLLEILPMPRNVSNQHDFMVSVPAIVYVDILQALLADIRDRISNGENAENESILMIHMLVYHWHDKIQIVFEDVYQKYVENARGVITKSLVGIPVALLVVTFVCAILAIHILLEVQQVVRFCLSSLCMVDGESVMSNQTISNFLVGIFPSDEKQLATIPPAVKSARNSAKDVIFEVTEEGHVKSVNNAAESEWHLKVSECTDIDLSLVLGFGKIKSIFQTHLDIEVTILSTGVTIPVNSYVVPLRDGRAWNGYIFCFEDLRELRAEEAKLEEEKVASEQLRMQIIPSVLREKVSERHGMLSYTIDWICILVVHMCDLNEFAKKQNAAALIKKYKDSVREFCRQHTAFVHVKSVGPGEYLAVNLAGDMRRVEIDRLFVQAATALYHRASRDGIHVSFSATADNDVLVGVLSKDILAFDIFSRCMRLARIMAKDVSPGWLHLDGKSFKNFPEAIKSKNLKAQAMKSGPVQYYCWKFKLPDPVSGDKRPLTSRQ
jgi:hypothetical protein